MDSSEIFLIFLNRGEEAFSSKDQLGKRGRFGDDHYPQEGNNGLGLQSRGVFGFPGVNSFERRTYAVGVEGV